MNKELFSKLFIVGEVIDSGGPSDRANHARLEILEIRDDSVHYKSLKSASRNHFLYSYIEVVLAGFDSIDPKSIQPSIQQVFLDAGLKKNYSTENYTYGFAKEIRRRLGLSEEPFISSGEILHGPRAASSETGKVLTEGALLQLFVDKRERNPEAVRICKELLGIQCVCCGFDFEEFYGPLGRGYIHVHHLYPISSTTDIYEIDPAKDLVPLCPNCHAMVHRGEALLTIPELQDLMRAARERATQAKSAVKAKSQLAGQAD